MLKSTKKSFFIAIILISSLLLAACSRDEEPTATPTATAAVEVMETPAHDPLVEPLATIMTAMTATISSVARASQIATPIPVPTLDAAGVIERGAQQLRNGDYAAARKDFQSVIDATDKTSDLHIQAQFDLARAYRADSMFEQALNTLGFFDALTSNSNSEMSRYTTQVLLLQGELEQSLGNSSAATENLQQILTFNPWAAELIHSELAAVYIAQGNIDEAIRAYRAAAEVANTDTSKAGWLELSARTASNASRYAEAITDYATILSFAKQSEYRADLQYRTGQMFAAAGDEARAIEGWKAAAETSPESRSAYLALVELVNRNVEFDLYQRGYIDLQSEAWFPAINAYQSYLDSVPITDTRYAPALLGLGQSQLGAEAFDAASAAFDRVIAEFPQCECFGRAWIDKAKTQIARGNSSDGRRIYRTFAREHASDPLAPEALWLSGVRALRDDNRMEAAADFLTLADTFPQSSRTPLALYAVATGAYQGGFYTQAANIYKRLQTDYPEQFSEAVRYWLGRSLDAHGENEQANVLWKTMVEQSPDSYYGVQAAMALQKKSRNDGAFLLSIAAVAGPPSRLERDDGSQSFAEQWLTASSVITGEQIGILTDTVANDVDLLQGKLLLAVDRRYEGLQYLNRLFNRYKGDPSVLYPLSLEFERIGAYQLSISSIQIVLQKSPAQLVEDAPIFLQQRLYPQPFAELIVKEAQAQKINPLLYFSLIRQESLFEEGARSGAAAQGLAQIIPDTARWVAERLGHPDWSDELIYRPYINLQFGAYYLDWARTYLDGNLVSALVGYNAGPGNAEYWREISGADDALFVEILAVNEPRIYVQAITSNLYHYTRLYTK